LADAVLVGEQQSAALSRATELLSTDDWQADDTNSAAFKIKCSLQIVDEWVQELAGAVDFSGSLRVFNKTTTLLRSQLQLLSPSPADEKDYGWIDVGRRTFARGATHVFATTAGPKNRCMPVNPANRTHAPVSGRELSVCLSLCLT
jgi:hypothetical protein